MLTACWQQGKCGTAVNVLVYMNKCTCFKIVTWCCVQCVKFVSKSFRNSFNFIHMVAFYGGISVLWTTRVCTSLLVQMLWTQVMLPLRLLATIEFEAKASMGMPSKMASPDLPQIDQAPPRHILFSVWWRTCCCTNKIRKQTVEWMDG